MKKCLTIATAIAALAMPATASAKPTWRVCGHAANGVAIVANAHTSCAFARRVARASGFDHGYPWRMVWPVSPATGRRVTMHRYGCGCSSFRPFGYRGGNHAAVEFRS